MKAYYERRAPEYDHWWLATGPYEGRERPRWREEVERLVALLRSLPPAPTLDVACGTGFLTQFLPGEVTALDQSESMLEIAAERLPAARIVHGDALELPFADGEFERVFTAHFYGHLDAGERRRFLAEAYRVADELVVVDSAMRHGVVAEGMQERVLADGSRWEVLKRYFTASELATELRARVLQDGRWFVVVAA
jgi:ubiquinone/menaquinone biosynthesis C-methylase UbiE